MKTKPSGRKAMTMQQFEGSAADKAADKKALKKINKGRGKGK